MRRALLLILLVISVCFTNSRPVCPVCKDTDQSAHVQSSNSDGDVGKMPGLTTIGLHVPRVTAVKLVSPIEHESDFLARIWTVQGIHRLRYMFHVILAIFLFCLAMLLIISLVHLYVQERRSERRFLRPKNTPVLIKPMPDMNKRYLVAV